MTPLAWLVRLAMAALYVWAGTSKLADPTEFAIEITNYRFLPALAPYLAVMLPAVEITVGAALILLPGPWRRASAFASLLLMAVFSIAVTQVVARGINVDCGCFGGASGPVTMWTVGRDLALVAASGWLMVSPSGRRS